MGGLQAAVVTQVPSRERFAELSQAWLTKVREELLPEFDRALGTPAGMRRRAAGSLLVSRDSASSSVRTRYSDGAWKRMLDSLSTDYPSHISLSASMLDDHGASYSRPHSDMLIGVTRYHRRSEWVSLRVHAFIGGGPFDPADMAAPYPDHRQRQWADFVKARAAQCEACYAHVTDDALASGDTALEVALRVSPADTVPRCHEVLRGYSWVTVCAAELAARLGGPAALAATEAFDEVTELPAGQVFLRATPLVQDYEGEQIRRVFQTLAPVLLTGRPRVIRDPILGRRLVPDVDAADFQ
jgi:hypothetical protein